MHYWFLIKTIIIIIIIIIIKKQTNKQTVIPCTKFHFRTYSTLHKIKKAGAALVRTITSIYIVLLKTESLDNAILEF